MNIRKIKQGALITFYNGLYLIVLGLFFVFFWEFTMKNNFKAITELWGFFYKFNPNISWIFFLLHILIGIFCISNGIFISYLSDYIYKRKEKFTWVVLFLSGIISWGGLLTVVILLKNIVSIGLVFFGWLSFVFGMLYPISYYLEKEYKEY